jgi:hypothetical protein
MAGYIHAVTTVTCGYIGFVEVSASLLRPAKTRVPISAYYTSGAGNAAQPAFPVVFACAADARRSCRTSVHPDRQAESVVGASQ